MLNHPSYTHTFACTHLDAPVCATRRMSAFVRSKPHVNIGTIGHVDHGKVRSHTARSESFRAHWPLVHHSSPSHSPLLHHTHTLWSSGAHPPLVYHTRLLRSRLWHTHHSCASPEHSLVLSVTHQMMNFVSCFIYFCFHCVPCGCSCSHAKAPNSLSVPCMAHAHTT
jgi:hypothetical protein